MTAATSDENTLVMGPDHKFAVLISGGYYASMNAIRYWNDIAFMYKVLKYQYGYKDENIYVLFSDGLDPAADNKWGESSNVDLDGDGLPDIDYSATLENIDTVFGALAARMEEHDILLVYTTGHGAPYDPDGDPTKTILYLWHNYIVDDELAEQVKRIGSYDTMVFVMSQCYSGGFEGELAAATEYSFRRQHTMSTASRVCTTRSWVIMNMMSSLIISPVHWRVHARTAGRYGPTRTGTGAASIAEAFSFAVNNDSTTETPQFADQSRFAEVDPLDGRQCDLT